MLQIYDFGIFKGDGGPYGICQKLNEMKVWGRVEGNSGYFWRGWMNFGGLYLLPIIFGQISWNSLFLPPSTHLGSTKNDSNLTTYTVVFGRLSVTKGQGLELDDGQKMLNPSMLLIGFSSGFLEWILITHPWWLDRSSLVGGFNPFEKYARQIGSFPQVGLKIKNIWNHHPILFNKTTPRFFFPCPVAISESQQPGEASP